MGRFQTGDYLECSPLSLGSTKQTELQNEHAEICFWNVGFGPQLWGSSSYFVLVGLGTTVWASQEPPKVTCHLLESKIGIEQN